LQIIVQILDEKQTFCFFESPWGT